MSKNLILSPEDLKYPQIFSKGNNRNSNLTLDISGKPIRGKIRRHLVIAMQLQQDRYNSQRESLKTLSIDELKELFNQIENNTLKKSKTDKQAILDTYYTKIIDVYKEYSMENLSTIDTKELNIIETEALKLVKNKKENENLKNSSSTKD